jgi:hypothetical protein
MLGIEQWGMPMISGSSCASGQTDHSCASSTTLCKHRYCTQQHLMPGISPSVCALWVLCKCWQMIVSNSVWHYCRSICTATGQIEMHFMVDFGGWWNAVTPLGTHGENWRHIMEALLSPHLKIEIIKHLWVKDAGIQEPWHHYQCTMLLWDPPRPSYIIRIHFLGMLIMGALDAWKHPFSHGLHCPQYRLHVLENIWHPQVQPTDVLISLGEDGLKLVTQLVNSIYENGGWLWDFI